MCLLYIFTTIESGIKFLFLYRLVFPTVLIIYMIINLLVLGEDAVNNHNNKQSIIINLYVRYTKCKDDSVYIYVERSVV